MSKAKQHLAQWLSDYLKNRDILARKIETISIEDDIVVVTHKDKTIKYYILAFDQNIDTRVAQLDPAKDYGLVFYNDKKNLELLKKHWDKLKDFQKLCVFFVNPFSKTDKRWIIYPHTHHRIADADSLHLGIDAMFEQVEPITQAEIEQLVHS